MDLEFTLRNSIRDKKIKGELKWLLFSILKRIQKNFKLGKRVVEFHIKDRLKSLNLFGLELIKFKTQENRDVSVLSYLKQNPFCFYLWTQLLLDNFKLKEKVKVLQSALFFFPNEKFLLIYSEIIFGIKTISSKKTFFFLKNFFFSISSSLRLEFLIKKKIILEIFNKIYKFNIVNFFNSEHYNDQRWVKNISISHIQETFLLTHINKNFVKNLNEDKSLKITVNHIILMKFPNYKALKIKKKFDKDIIDIFLKFFFFRKRDTSDLICIIKNKIKFGTKTNDFMGNIVVILFRFEFKKMIASYIENKFWCNFLKKDFCRQTFLFTKEFGLSLFENIFSEKLSCNIYSTKICLFYPHFYPLVSDVGFIENNKKFKRQLKFTNPTYLFFSSYANGYSFKLIL